VADDCTLVVHTDPVVVTVVVGPTQQCREGASGGGEKGKGEGGCG